MMRRVLLYTVGAVLLGVGLAGFFWAIFKLSGNDTARPGTTAPTATQTAAGTDTSSDSGTATGESTMASTKTGGTGSTAATPQQRQVAVTFLHAGQHQFTLGPQPWVVCSPDASPQIRVDIEGLRAALTQAAETWAAQFPAPTGARRVPERGKLQQIVRGTPRTAVDIDATLAATVAQIETAAKSAAGADGAPLPAIALAIVTRLDEGSASFESIRKTTEFTTQLGTYTTRYRIEDADRTTNLRIAVDKIDGCIIGPGEEFSFNRIVGPRTAKCGFKKAGVISNGKVIPGLGGGICQVSTTLFNAALQANLDITERHHHSIFDGIPYAQKGLDAAVVYGAKDFRFRNSHPFPVLISAVMHDGRLTTQVFGPRKPFDEIRLETRNLKPLPPSEQRKTNTRLKPGEVREVSKGVTGYTVDAFRIVVANGKTTERKLHSDHYLTFPRVVEVPPTR